MSADKWTECPVCMGRYETAVDALRADIQNAIDTDKPYKLVVELQNRLKAIEGNTPAETLRWDYEFYDVEPGYGKTFEVRAKIRLGCDVCNHNLVKDILIDKDS